MSGHRILQLVLLFYFFCYIIIYNEDKFWDKFRLEIFMEKEKLDRIGELSRKSKSEGLTDEEKAEQKALREEYIETMKRNFRSILDNIELK